jgi:predicted GTPase
MRFRDLLIRYWRELCLVALIILPFVALLPIGFLWLWENAALHWWILGSTAAGIGAIILKTQISRTTTKASVEWSAAVSPPSAEWNDREVSAWKIVERIVIESDSAILTDRASLIQTVELVMDSIAEHFHANAADARWRISLPEALLLVEKSSKAIRRQLLEHVPGAQHIQVTHALTLKNAYERYGDAVSTGLSHFTTLARLVRLSFDSQVLPRILVEYVLGEVGGYLSQRVRKDLTAILIREVGRAAIDLYSGRLRLDADELNVAAREESKEAVADLVGPIRILVAGQVNAGKSSLINAMCGEIQRRTGISPVLDNPQELLLKQDGKPEIVLIDMPGIGLDQDAESALQEKLRTTDLLLWVASATQSARAPDLKTLDGIRELYAKSKFARQPPIIIALTHIDHLTPATEWSPPYDLLALGRPKARRIRDAIEHASEALLVDAQDIVPVCLKDPTSPYNLDLIWLLISTKLQHAKHVKLERMYRGASQISPSEILSQLISAGRWIAGSVWRGGQ